LDITQPLPPAVRYVFPCRFGAVLSVAMEKSPLVARSRSPLVAR